MVVTLAKCKRFSALFTNAAAHTQELRIFYLSQLQAQVNRGDVMVVLLLVKRSQRSTCYMSAFMSGLFMSYTSTFPLDVD